MRKLYMIGRYCLPVTTVILLFFTMLLTPATLKAQLPLTSASPTASENFDGIGTGATLPANWKASANATARLVDAFSAAGTVTNRSGGNTLSTTAGNGIYNYGAGPVATATDRAVGGLSSTSSSVSVNIYTSLINNDPNPISSFNISFDVEKYRDGMNANGYSIQLYYSTDGTTWVSAGANFLKSFPADADNNGFASAPGSSATISNTLTPPAPVASGSTLYLAWNYSVNAGTSGVNSQGLGIDNFSVTATYSGAPPSGTTTATPASLSGFSTVAGTPSAFKDFNVSGSGLTNNITITAPTPYEISTDSTNYLPAVTLTQSGGTVAATPLVVRISAGATAGAASGSISIASAGSSSQSIGLTGTVSSATPVVAPLQRFHAVALSTTEIDLQDTANVTGNNIVLAWSPTPIFGTPSGALTAGSTISGGGTVLYTGPPTNVTPFQHTGLTPGTTYYYSAWSVDASNNYSTALIANATTFAVPANVVINQIYGGGGNSGGIYSNDFIELYNNESTAVNLAGWSVQYASSTGTAWQVTKLNGIIPSHGFYLVQEAIGANNPPQPALPTPDSIGTINMSATNGKVILCNTVLAQSGSNPDPSILNFQVRDKVGYGAAANGFEGSGPAPLLANDSADFRVTDGVDHNDNKTDFITGTPLPRNSSYTTTAPVIASLTPANGVTGIPSTLTPKIVFNKPVVKGTGTITLFTNGNPGTPIDVNDASIVISNRSTVTINTALSGGNSYSILISAGAFTDAYGNAFAGISSNTTWAFTTYNSAVATTLPATFNFQACTGNGLLPNGFTQYSTTGAQIWDCTAFGRDPNAPTGTAAFPNGVQINGFANGVNNLNMDWLISPKLDLTGTTFPLLSFWSRNAFDGATLQLKISTDYTGSGDPALATWTDLNGKFPSSGSDTWTLSGNINLSSYKQNSVYIAFVYTSTTDDGSRWTLDDISLVNSSTPPPPSLTLSAATLEFGYTATGSTSTQTLVVTGNDLVGDVTLTTTGNFQISTDGGTTFGSTATITQATANNVPQTVIVRFAPATNNIQYSETLTVAISDSTGTVTLKGNSIDPASTLNVVDWNLNWFATPDPTLGPTDKSLQETNVAIVLKSLPADLFALQEVVNQHALDSIVATMPGYAYVVGQYGSFSNPNEPTADPLTEVQKLAFVYNTAKISNIHTDSLLTLGVTNPADLSNPYYNDFASGRFPYMMTADVKLSDNNGGFITQKIRFINIHAKANTAPVLTAYQRRLAGARGLDSLIKLNYINDNVVILGDFNDDLNQTITAGVTPPVSSYSPFTVTDASLYIFPTMPLSPAGQHSDVSFTSVIDNVMATNAMAKYYLPSSATVLSNVANLVSKYGTTTTDHYPVFTQYSFSTALALPVNLLSFTAVKQNAQVKVSWSTAQEENSQSFDVERSADGSNSSFTKIGTVAAQGFSSVKTDYSFIDKLPLAGVNYYRLKQVDRDGKFVYSSVVKLNFAASFSISITPNPASTFVNIGVNNATEAITIQIIDLNGRLVKQQVITPGTQGLPIQVGGLAKGLYTVKAISSSAVSTQKVLIQ